MKNFVLILVIISVLLIMSQICFSQIPESKRSKDVVKKYYPILEKKFAEKNLKFGSNVFLRIFKEENYLEIWVKKDNSYVLFKTYEICYFSGGLGPKKKQGDGKSPEGFYNVKPKSLNPYSTFHLSFDTGYPNQYDRSHGYTGSALMVHGNCVSIGCYAMTDERIEEIYSIIQKSFENGQSSISLHIFPFKMTDKRMASSKDSEYYAFWENLKEGYDFFEKNNKPPVITVKNKRYVISQ